MLMKKTSLVFALLSAFAAAAWAQATAENATVSAGINNIVVEAHGVQPKVPLFFSATVDESIHAAPDAVTAEMKIKLTVLQGQADVLTLGLSGNGDISDVSGVGLRDWAVRKAAGKMAVTSTCVPRS